MATVLDHRVRETTGGEAEVSAEAHCKAQVQLKQFPVHEHLASQRRLPLLCSFLTGNLSDGACRVSSMWFLPQGLARPSFLSQPHDSARLQHSNDSG